MEGVRIGAKEALIVDEQQGQAELFHFEDVPSDDNGGGDNGWMVNNNSLGLKALLLEYLNSAAACVFWMQSLHPNQLSAINKLLIREETNSKLLLIEHVSG